MGAVFLKLLHMSLAAAILVVVVMLLRLLLKNAPKAIHCALWALVALRLVLPVSVESNLSLIPEDVANGNVVSEWTNDYIDDVDIHRPDSVYYDAAIGAGREPISDGEGGYYVVTKHDQLGEPATVGNTVIPILGWVWLGGCVVMLGYALVSFLRIRGKVAVSLRLRDNIWRSEAVDSPFILGIFRPKIYLPYDMDEAQTRYVVAHEEAHLRRRDHWWKPLGFLLLAVYWFNPLLWAAYLLLCRDIELACDEKVIREMDAQEKKAYSEALLSCSLPRRMVAACPLAFGEVGVKQRIASVLHYKKPAFWVLVVAIIACIVVAVCFLTNPKEDDSPTTLYEDDYVTITVPKKYAKLIKMEGIEEASSLDLDFYYKSEYSLDEQQPSPENNGGWLLTVELSTPYFKQKSGEGWVCTCWQPNDAMVYVERRPTEEGYHCSEENMAEFLTVMNAIVVTYHDLDPFSTDHIPPLVPLSTAEQNAACAALLADLRTGWWTSTPIEANKEAASFECLYREVENGQIRLYGYGLYQWYPDLYQDVETIPYWAGLTIVTLEAVSLRPVEVWRPGDGAYHDISLAENFPAEILDTLNALPVTRLYQGFSARLIRQGQQTMNPAEELFAVIVSSPADVSKPADYLDAHSAELEALLANEEATLRYVFTEFLEGGQEEPRGQVMRLVLDRLVPEAQLRLYTETGQEYFDEWMAAADRVAAQHGLEWMKEHQPSLYFALQVRSELYGHSSPMMPMSLAEMENVV